jgi:hypothetical protein
MKLRHVTPTLKADAPVQFCTEMDPVVGVLVYNGHGVHASLPVIGL